VLTVAAATDVLDGWLARRAHQESAIGAAVDALADKVFVLTVVFSLLVSGRISVAGVLLLATRDIGEILLGLRLMLMRRSILGHSANAGGKIATILQYVAVVAVVLESSKATLFIGLAGIAGLVATIGYFLREISTEHHQGAR
jgi:phosphatidylglycerophosphate synthase